MEEFLVLKISLAPISDNCSVLGIGVAERVNVSTFFLIFLIFSFVETQIFAPHQLLINLNL